MGVQVALPDHLAGLPVARDQRAVEEGAVDLAAVVGRPGDVDRCPCSFGSIRVRRDLVVAELDRFAVAVLVDRVGDAAGDRGRELDQRVGVDVQAFNGGSRSSIGAGEVVGPLRDAAEEGPRGGRGFVASSSEGLLSARSTRLRQFRFLADPSCPTWRRSGSPVPRMPLRPAASRAAAWRHCRPSPRSRSPESPEPAVSEDRNRDQDDDQPDHGEAADQRVGRAPHARPSTVAARL